MKKEISEENKKRLDVIASYFRELRFSDGLTQAEVGENVNLHQNTVSRIENGYNMNLISLFELCDFYGVTVSEIINDQL